MTPTTTEEPMPEYEVTIIAEARGRITVEAANEEEAEAKAKQAGMEIHDIDELSEQNVYEVAVI